MRQGREIADHVGRVMNIVEGRSRPAQTDPAYERLARSWRRSLNKHSIDPGLSSVPKVVTAYELREHRERIETFMRIAREGVERLHHELLPANYCVLLTDATGVTVDYRTVPALEKEFKDEGFRNGTCWAEEHEGTCGVGTTLADRQPPWFTVVSTSVRTTRNSPAARHRYSGCRTSRSPCSMPRRCIRRTPAKASCWCSAWCATRRA